MLEEKNELFLLEYRWYHGTEHPSYFYRMDVLLFLGGRHMEMKPKYDPREVEKGRYEEWVSNGYFKPSEDKSKEAYTIVIPPLM